MANIFDYFEAVGDWGKYHVALHEALTEIGKIEGLPEDFSIDYIKYKEGVGIRVEHENAGSKATLVNNILKRLEEETQYLLSDIVIQGIEPDEEYKALVEQEKRGEITAEEIEKITRRPYTVKE